ncbi:MAG: DUF799 domain-containing protein [Treponema sp.]|nr:DUF799 domain-containing protein [Treponema sp.]
MMSGNKPPCVTLAALALIFLFCRCATAPVEITGYSPGDPRSILVLPPLNFSMDVGASPVFLSASVMPLAEYGYYVIPVALSQEMFMQNGIQTPQDAHDVSYTRLRDIFGADAALYITITAYGTSFQLIRSVVQAAAYARLVDLRTGIDLWSGSVYVEQGEASDIDLAGGNIGLQILGMIGRAAVEQIINSVVDTAHEVGRSAAHQLLSSLGISHYGPYHPQYGAKE